MTKLFPSSYNLEGPVTIEKINHPILANISSKINYLKKLDSIFKSSTIKIKLWNNYVVKMLFHPNTPFIGCLG